jgi:hypothetical protein
MCKTTENACGHEYTQHTIGSHFSSLVCVYLQSEPTLSPVMRSSITFSLGHTRQLGLLTSRFITYMNRSLRMKLRALHFFQSPPPHKIKLEDAASK